MVDFWSTLQYVVEDKPNIESAKKQPVKKNDLTGYIIVIRLEHELIFNILNLKLYGSMNIRQMVGKSKCLNLVNKNRCLPDMQQSDKNTHTKTYVLTSIFLLITKNTV